MDAAAVFLLGLAVFSLANGLGDLTYTIEPSLSGKIPSDVTSLSSRSMVDCAALCSSDNDCLGVYYSTAPQRCYLDTNGSTDFQADLSAVYLTKSSYVDTSTKIVSSASCPESFEANIVLLGASGNYYPFTVIHSEVNYTTAAIMCSDLGLQLVKVNDDTKVLDVADFLTTCLAYDAIRYWTDARKRIPGAGQPWYNSDGSAANLTNVWCSGSNEGGTDTCLRFRRSCSYSLNDFACSKKCSVICEERQEEEGVSIMT